MHDGFILLGYLKETDLTWLAMHGDVETVQENAVLMEAGQNTDNVYIILDGQISLGFADGETHLVSTGDLVGEMSFVEKRPPSVTAVAKRAARVLRIPKAALSDELDRNGEFAARLYHGLASFLANRIRSMAVTDGSYEMDEALLDKVHVAGDRAHRLIAIVEEVHGVHGPLQ